MDVLAALRLQVEWGADEAIEAAPIDRLAARMNARPTMPDQPARPGTAREMAAVSMLGAGELSPPPAPPVSAPARGAPAGRPAIVTRAQQVAAAAPTIAALRAALAGFTECPLSATATNLVFADGNAAAGIVLVGEAPGAEEDLSGRPFVGQSGKLLDRMLASIGLTRDRDVLITNLIPWRPPGNRPPTDSEIATCLPFLLRHLALLRPRVVVSLGALSTRLLTGQEDGIRRVRGRWQAVTITGLPEKVALLPMLHPAYLLRTPGAKKDAWQDLIALRRRLDKSA